MQIVEHDYGGCGGSEAFQQIAEDVEAIRRSELTARPPELFEHSPPRPERLTVVPTSNPHDASSESRQRLAHESGLAHPGCASDELHTPDVIGERGSSTANDVVLSGAADEGERSTGAHRQECRDHGLTPLSPAVRGDRCRCRLVVSGA
jgi:hypothetical protein